MNLQNFSEKKTKKIGSKFLLQLAGQISEKCSQILLIRTQLEKSAEIFQKSEKKLLVGLNPGSSIFQKFDWLKQKSNF